jgi:phage shock protein A
MLHDYLQANERMMQWSNSFNNAFKEGNTALAISALQRMSYFGRLCEAIKRELL